MVNGKWLTANRRTRGTTGVVAFSTILVLGAIVVEVGVAATALIYVLSRSNYGVRLSNEAFAAARAGIDDGIMRVVRERFYPSCTAAYTVATTPATRVDVTIQNSACSAAVENAYVISATGKSVGKRRTLEAVLDVGGVAREVRVVAVTEISP